jgi:hypothetical protein
VHVEGSISGLSGQCPALSFSVNGVSIITNGSTDFRKGGCKHVDDSQSVSVDGTRLPGGVVLASQVEIAKGHDGDSHE